MKAISTPSQPPRDVRDAEDLLDALQSAVASKTKIDLRGSGRHLQRGRPVHADQVLCLAPMSGIVTYEPDELVLITKAATPLRDILKTLDDAGQMLAFDPPLGHINPEEALGTLGGVMATNLAGPRRMVAGAARDYLLGFQAISGRGEQFQSGSRVMKNVTGYDLSKLMVGSYGTLAVMHEVTIKTMPKPEYGVSLIIKARDIQAAYAAIRAAFASPHEPTAGAIMPPQTSVYSKVKKIADMGQQSVLVSIRIEGFKVSVKDRIKALSDVLKSYGEQITLTEKESNLLQAELREVTLLPEQKNRVLWKISCPPHQGAGLLDQILARPHCRAYADWAGGLIWVSHPAGHDGGAVPLRQLLSTTGGHATLISAPKPMRETIEVFHPQPQPLQDLTRRVKASFDPLGILNPGRMYEGI